MYGSSSSLPGRTGQRWDATRAPRQWRVAWGGAHVRPLSSVHAIANKAINPSLPLVIRLSRFGNLPTHYSDEP